MKHTAVVLALLFSWRFAGLPAQTPTVSTSQTVTPGAPSPQTPGTPTRTPPRAGKPGEDPQKGTAILRGYVVAADTGNPVRRAMVRVMASDGRGGGVTTTDAQGRFEVKDLPAGRYTLSATKAGYVTMSYGQRRPEQPGTVLDVLDGQLVEKIAILLPPGGVITGRVVDEFGDPVAGAQVQSLRYRFQPGGQRLLPMGAGMTDDRGSFRLFGLTPGDYYVSATLRMEPMTMPGMTTASMEGYAPTYHPGTPNPSEAQRVTVRAGQETAGVAFALVATRLARVSGRVLSSSGEPVASAFVEVRPDDRSGAGMMMFFGGGQTRADGNFEVAGLPPGSYVLTVRPRGSPMDARTEFGQARITVASDDELTNLVIVTSPGGIARGTITTDETTPLPVRPQQVTVSSRPMEFDVRYSPGNSQVNDDWTFELSGLSDRRLISVFLTDNSEWVLKGVYLRGQDVTDTATEFVPGQTVDGFQIVFTRQKTSLSGRITDDRNQPVTDATVIIFPEDSSRWTFGSRYMRSARPDQGGRYQVAHTPPADYLVIAVRELEPGRLTDPEYLGSIRHQATRVSLMEGESRVQDLRVIKQ